MKEVDEVTRPILRYYGGKFRIAPWIISFFPEHNTYVEPFMGALSVLLTKPPSKCEVANDLDSNVVNFFKVLREKPAELRRAIELTPFSREECYLSCKPIKQPLEAARRFYVRAWQTQHGAPHMGRNGWRFTRVVGKEHRHYSVDDWNDHDKIPSVVERLKNVQFEHDDAFLLIPRFDSPSALFYVDPPYLPSTRADRWRRNGYVHEMEEADHKKLAHLLHSVKGMVIISGYPSPLYERLYSRWKMVATKTHSSQRRASENAATERTECLWISPNAAGMHRQMELL